MEKGQKALLVSLLDGLFVVFDLLLNDLSCQKSFLDRMLSNLFYCLFIHDWGIVKSLSRGIRVMFTLQH